MLKITTSNGDTLIHADQQPDSYNGRSADGSTYMVHGGAWGNHKYIRKEGNKYIYPEDLAKMQGSEKRQAKKTNKAIEKRDREFLKEDKKITNDMRKELNNYGVNVNKKQAADLRNVIKREGQIQQAHQQSIYTAPGQYNQTRMLNDPSEAKKRISERRKIKEASTRPLRTADQMGSAHKESISVKNNSDGSKSVTKRLNDVEGSKRRLEDRRKEAGRNSSTTGSGSDIENSMRNAESKRVSSASSLDAQKQKTKARKTQKRVEDVLKKKRENNRPKSRDKKVVSGGKKVKTGKTASGGKVHP